LSQNFSRQDCELEAFYRLAARLKAAFPALKIMMLLDGLYAKGPVVEICRNNNRLNLPVWG